MATPPNVRATCKAVQKAQIPIDLGNPEGKVTPEDPHFNQRCEEMFSKALAYKRSHYPNHVWIWTPAQIRTAKEFMARHGIDITIYGTDHPNGRKRPAISGISLSLSAGVPVERLATEFSLFLDHEAGHHRDQQLILSRHPELKEVLATGLGTVKQAQELLIAKSSLIADQLPAAERDAFFKRANEVFSNGRPLNFDQVLMANEIVGELIRFGEQVADKRESVVASKEGIQEWGLVPERPYTEGDYEALRQMKSSKHADYLARVLGVAFLQEAGLWEKFKANKATDPKILSILDEKDIAFFRLCIRAAANYFPTIR
ncbi:MAG: hypothetical protein Q7S98_02165 [Deltaproteobacteria bacterium]|nr:hypothetical protein [Deltaproteobacteria bacterium]